MASYRESAAEAVAASTKARVPLSAPDITAEPVRCVTGRDSPVREDPSRSTATSPPGAAGRVVLEGLPPGAGRG